MERSDPAIQWLLRSTDSSIRYLTLTDLLDEPLDAREVQATRERIPKGPRVCALLAGQGAG